MSGHFFISFQDYFYLCKYFCFTPPWRIADNFLFFFKSYFLFSKCPFLSFSFEKEKERSRRKKEKERPW